MTETEREKEKHWQDRERERKEERDSQREKERISKIGYLWGDEADSILLALEQLNWAFVAIPPERVCTLITPLVAEEFPVLAEEFPVLLTALPLLGGGFVFVLSVFPVWCLTSFSLSVNSTSKYNKRKIGPLMLVKRFKVNKITFTNWYIIILSVNSLTSNFV